MLLFLVRAPFELAKLSKLVEIMLELPLVVKSLGSDALPKVVASVSLVLLRVKDLLLKLQPLAKIGDPGSV